MCCDIPAESWYDLSNSIKISICNAKTMSFLRKKHIKYSSAIIQSKSFVQLSLYANLNVPHGHRDLLNHNDNCVAIKVLSAVDKLKEGEMVQHIEYKSEKMDPIFIYILNRLKSKFKNIIKKKAFGQDSIVGGKNEQFRQPLSEDFGFNGGQYHTRTKQFGHTNHLPFGVAIPYTNVIEGVKEGEGVHSIFSSCSDELKNKCNWIWKNIEEARRTSFANSIHKQNIIEALRIAIYRFDVDDLTTTYQNLCSYHMDKKNDPVHSQVAVFSKMIWDSANETGRKGWRVAIICYTRKSISDYYKRINLTCGPAVEHCLYYFEQFKSWRVNIIDLKEHINEEMEWKRTQRKFQKGMPYYQYTNIPCHLNVLVFLSTIIDTTSSMIIKFQFDYTEAVSILRAFAAMPHTVYYFVKVCWKIMYNIDNYKYIVKNNRGPLIGWVILQEMRLHYEKDVDTKKKRPNRFALQFDSKKNNITKERWIEEVRNISYWWLTSLKDIDENANRRDNISAYGTAYRRTKETILHSGRMVINNLLAIAAIIGMVPLPYIEFYHNANGCPAIQVLVKKKQLRKGQESANIFLDSFSHALKEIYDYYCDRRIGENVTCIIERVICESDELFSDYYFELQCLFYVKDGFLYIINPKHCSGKMKTSLFTEWMYNGKWMTTQQLLLQINEELESVNTFSLPQKFNNFSEENYKKKYSCHKFFEA